MPYKKALVLFIDILGSQNRTDFEELLSINETFHGQLEQNQANDANHSYTVYKRKIFTFSDCAYIIYDFKDDIEEERKDLRQLFDIALRNTEPLLVEFLKKGFLCRGGVAYGDVYYETERSLFFGPAINRAYQLEKDVARFPRIIVDSDIAAHVVALNEERVNSARSPKEAAYMKFINGEIVLSDDDGMFYLNYLNQNSHAINLCESEEIWNLWIKKIPHEISMQMDNIEKLRAELQNCHDDSSKQKCQKGIMRCQGIIAKYNWLSTYLEAISPKNLEIQSTLFSILFDRYFGSL